jgi:hypothetical protein
MESDKLSKKLSATATLEEAIRYLRLSSTGDSTKDFAMIQFVCDLYHLTVSELTKLRSQSK